MVEERQAQLACHRMNPLDHVGSLLLAKNALHSDSSIRQCIGIPMGTDYAPVFANLYLFKLEYKFMKNLLKTNMSKARLFSNMLRYIDDLLTLNNPSFGNVFGDIDLYPPELILKRNEWFSFSFRCWDRC